MGTPIQQRLVPQHGSEVHAKTWAQATVITIKAPLPPGEDKIKQTRSIVRATMKCALFFCFDGEPSPDDVREIIQDIDGEFQYRRQKPSIAELANAIRDRQAGFHGPRDGNAKTFLGQAGQRFTTLIHEVTAVRQALYQPSNAFILAFMPEPAQSTFQTCISAWLQAKRNRPCRPLSDRYYAKLLCSSVRDAPSLAQGANIVLITTRETQTFQLRLCTAATERNVHCRCCNTAFCHNFSRQINRLKDRDLRITDTEDLAGNGIHGITIEMRFEAGMSRPCSVYANTVAYRGRSHIL
ncbi:hypothetical protein CALVIDRAFT_410333 [Calocera viscosa TUFC12733]|uniref:Uncharacterized protein n=1 Tax=Calocera viscosa (strain TUFC12733) TaxID=1330018 RepID=A0A167G6W0_CALVF|nr:hypothetical protein CALVIDRAFT_410333 [Calocera viscosa TUFC12733]